MVAIDDLDANLTLEREWTDADSHANHKELWGETMKSHVETGQAEDMKVMSAGDVTIHHHPPAEKPGAVIAASVPAVTPATPQAVASTVGKWLLPAAVIAAGVGAPLAWKLPEIVSSFAPKPSGDIFDQFDLVVGGPKEEPKEE